MIDTTIGVLIAYVLLLGVEKLVKKYQIERLKTGHYTVGDTAKIDLKAWGAQLGVWNLITVVMKSILVGFMFALANILNKIGEYILSAIADHPKIELVLVMIVTPGIMNVFQFWVQDNFLKEDIIEERNLLDVGKKATNEDKAAAGSDDADSETPPKPQIE
jgi:hypothetical protein